MKMHLILLIATSLILAPTWTLPIDRPTTDEYEGEEGDNSTHPLQEVDHPKSRLEPSAGELAPQTNNSGKKETMSPLSDSSIQLQRLLLAYDPTLDVNELTRAPNPSSRTSLTTASEFLIDHAITNNAIRRLNMTTYPSHPTSRSLVALSGGRGERMVSLCSAISVLKPLDLSQLSCSSFLSELAQQITLLVYKPTKVPTRVIGCKCTAEKVTQECWTSFVGVWFPKSDIIHPYRPSVDECRQQCIDTITDLMTRESKKIGRPPCEWWGTKTVTFNRVVTTVTFFSGNTVTNYVLSPYFQNGICKLREKYTPCQTSDKSTFILQAMSSVVSEYDERRATSFEKGEKLWSTTASAVGTLVFPPCKVNTKHVQTANGLYIWHEDFAAFPSCPEVPPISYVPGSPQALNELVESVRRQVEICTLRQQVLANAMQSRTPVTKDFIRSHLEDWSVGRVATAAVVVNETIYGAMCPLFPFANYTWLGGDVWKAVDGEGREVGCVDARLGFGFLTGCLKSTQLPTVVDLPGGFTASNSSGEWSAIPQSETRNQILDNIWNTAQDYAKVISEISNPGVIVDPTPDNDAPEGADQPDSATSVNGFKEVWNWMRDNIAASVFIFLGILVAIIILVLLIKRLISKNH